MTDSNLPPLVPRLILVGIDYSAESAAAATDAIRMARSFSAHVHLLHAWSAPYAPPPSAAEATTAVPEPNQTSDLLTLVRRTAEAQMTEFVASLDTTGVAVTASVESGDPGRVLPEYAERHECSWIVVGKRTLSHVSEWFLGDVATYVVRHCQVPVLVVPSREAT